MRGLALFSLMLLCSCSVSSKPVSEATVIDAAKLALGPLPAEWQPVVIDEGETWLVCFRRPEPKQIDCSAQAAVAKKTLKVRNHRVDG